VSLPIYLTTRREVIRAVPATFKSQYGNRPNDFLWKAKKTIAETVAELESLDVDTCDPEAVNEAIGNRSWTAHDCSSCGQTCETLVHIGEEPDYEARYQDLCKSCVSHALALFNAA